MSARSEPGARQTAWVRTWHSGVHHPPLSSAHVRTCCDPSIANLDRIKYIYVHGEGLRNLKSAAVFLFYQQLLIVVRRKPRELCQWKRKVPIKSLNSKDIRQIF